VSTEESTPTRRSAWIEVDPSAIRDNVQSVRSWLEPTRYLAVVKANGYGHGLVTAARAAVAGGAEKLGVAILEEGATLRSAGVEAPILILGASLPECAGAIVGSDLAQTVADTGLLDALNDAAGLQGKVARVHLKIDTGMGRVGVPPRNFDALHAHAVALPHICVDGLATHIGWEDDTSIETQVRSFRDLTEGFPDRDAHAANSLVAIRSNAARMDWARIGLLTYGVLPQPLYEASIRLPETRDLRPALSIVARITQLRTADPGQTVSYGGTFTVDRPSRLAILPVGYADGYPRALSNRGHVLIHGHRCPVRGAVCMDQTVVDVTDCPDARPGDPILLVGSDGPHRITINDLARTAGTIPHDILAGLGPRLPRVATPS
jgi:alanine racemase